MCRYGVYGKTYSAWNGGSMKKTVLRVTAVLLCIMLTFGVLGVQKTYAAGSSSSENAVYELANRYYRIKAVKNGKYLLGNRAGYEAQANTADKAMVFYFKPAELGIYILYDCDSKYLTVNAFNAIVRTDGLGDNIKWFVESQSDGTFCLFNVVKQKYVCISGTSLKWKSNPDSSCHFIFEEAEGNNPFPEADVCMSFKDSEGNEISAADVMSAPAVGERIIGYADTHVHLNHNLGSGKVVFAGSSYSPLGIRDALKACTSTHGVNGCFDLWGKIVDGCDSHNTSGYPDLTYWPNAHSDNHIQTYYKWLERAYLSGQRLLVQQCVNNKTLGLITNALPPYANAELDDMDIAKEQIEDIKAMQKYIDAQCGGPGKGWFRIVTSAAEARQVISEGKMAVFLSLEMDTVFDCDKDYIGMYEAGEISEATMNAKLNAIEAQIDEFYDLGIRSVFPTHALNNGFAGCQLYKGEVFSIMNYLNRGDFYQPEEAKNPRVFYKQPKAELDESLKGHQNSIGLTKTGEWLIHKLIDKKYVIEVDHMSDKALNAVIDILWEEKYPGIIASHTRLLDLFEEDADRCWEQMDIPRMIKIMQLGGIISPMLWETMEQHQMCVSDYLEAMIEISADGVPTVGYPDFGKKDYQKYNNGNPYGVPTTWYNQNGDSRDDIILGVPFGTDVNGACFLPYFDDCEGKFTEVDYDNFDALYPGLYAENVSEVKIDRQTTGNRTFDINKEGVAHYGLIPDMIERLSTTKDIINTDALFNSAEAYIRMFERMERYSDTYPDRNEVFWPEADTEYWHDNK